MLIRVPVLGNMIEDVKKNGLHGLGPSPGRGVQQSPCLFHAVPGGYLIQDETLDCDRRGSRHGDMLPRHQPANVTCVIFTKQSHKSRVATQPGSNLFTRSRRQIAPAQPSRAWPSPGPDQCAGIRRAAPSQPSTSGQTASILSLNLLFLKSNKRYIGRLTVVYRL